MSRKIEFTQEAEDDLVRLFDFILERELNSSTPDLDLADEAVNAIRLAIEFLAVSPFIGRKIGTSFERELIISFGKTGYVAMYRIDPGEVVIAAVRHQMESDYN